MFLGRGQMGKEVVTPTNSFLLLGVLTSVPILVKIDQENGKNATVRTDKNTYTDRRKPVL